MTEKKLQKLLKKYHVPAHIVEHMKKTAEVCEFIAKKLGANKIELNLELLCQSALLHDLVKLVDFPKVDLAYFKVAPPKKDLQFWQKLIKKYHKDRHCVAAYKILLKEKEPEIALIVKKHYYNSLIDPKPGNQPNTWEEKILYYADKRVASCQIVSLKHRIKDGQKRYFPDGNVPASDLKVQKALFKLEKELCSAAGIKPAEIK